MKKCCECLLSSKTNHAGEGIWIIKCMSLGTISIGYSMKIDE